MSTAKTAAAIGIKITADPSQAEKAIVDLDKQIGGLKGSEGWVSGLSSGAQWLGAAGTTALGRFAGVATETTSRVAKLGVGLGTLGATAAAVGFADMATSFATAGAQAGRTADRLGMPVTRLSELQIAAKLAGSSAEDMTSSLVGLQASVHNAAMGNDNGALNAFHAIGIDVGDAARGVKDYAALLPKLADETQKLASVDPHAALHLLDAVGVSRDLFPLLRKGSAYFAELTAQAQQFHPIQPADVEKGRQLEVILTRIGETFGEFERIGGAAIAPGLTKFLGTFQSFLQDHQGDVTTFFDSVEHGIEWLTTPKNMAWLRKELDETADSLKTIGHLADEIEHSTIFRTMFGLGPDGQQSGLMKFLTGTPEEGVHQVWNAITGGDSKPNLGSPEQDARSQKAMSFFMANGWTKEQAAGLAGNIQAESGFRPDATNGSHSGLAQWSESRQKDIEGHFHKSVAAMGFDEQLQAMQWELTEGKYKGVGDQLHGAKDATSAATIIDHGYEVPALPGTPAMASEDAARAALARHANDSYSNDPAAQRFAKDAGATKQPDGSAPSTAPGSTTLPASDPNMMPTAPASPDPNMTPSYSAPSGTAADGRMSRLLIELRHTNPPPGADLRVLDADPAQIDFSEVRSPTDLPRVMGAMPNSGQRRNVARDGY